MRPGIVAQQAQVIRHADSGLGGAKARAVILGPDDPLGPRLIRAHGAVLLKQEHNRMVMAVDGTWRCLHRFL